MRKRPARRKKLPARLPLRPPYPGAWSIMAVDSEPIRKKVRSEYEKVLRGLEQAKQQVERFHSIDQPLHTKWLSATFGALLTQTREIQEKLYQTQFLVEQVQAEYVMGGHPSLASAYRKVLRRQTHPEEFEEEMKQAEKEAEEARKRFKEFFGFTPEDDEDEDFDDSDFSFDPFTGEGEFDDSRPGARGFAHSQSKGRLKELYRNVVRRLHPDSAGQRSALQMEWWHQAQEAYQQGDLEQLEMILTLAEMEESGAKNASLSMLQMITAKFKQGLNALRRDLRRHKADDAWNFSLLKDLEPIRLRTHDRLDGERRQLAERLRRCEKVIASWVEPASEPRKERTRRRRRSPAEPEPWF